jgi:hypothetical protein
MLYASVWAMNIKVMVSTAKAAARVRSSRRATGMTARAVPTAIGIMRTNGR